VQVGDSAPEREIVPAAIMLALALTQGDFAFADQIPLQQKRQHFARIAERADGDAALFAQPASRCRL